MFRQHSPKSIGYSIFVAMLAAAWMGLSDTRVGSESAVTVKPLNALSQEHLRGPAQEIPNVEGGQGPAGSLDPSFGNGGKLTARFGSEDFGHAIAVQPDGKIVAAGSVRRFPDESHAESFAVFRYNTDGSLDSSFGENGRVFTSFNISGQTTSQDAAFAVAIQSDGKIVAAGVSYTPEATLAALARYNSDGSLDTAFGSGGKVLSPGADIGGIVIQPDGKIVAEAGGFTLIRYNANGSLDTTFGSGGFVETSFGESFQGVFSVALQPDGKIVASGDSLFCDEKNCYTSDFAVARYDHNGSLDTSFDSDGKLTTHFDGVWSVASSVFVQPDGKIVAAGFDYQTLAVARYNADGSLDATFDDDGKALQQLGPGGWYREASAALQPDGKIVIGSGTFAGGSGEAFGLVRLNADGSLDTSFDGDGRLMTNFGGGGDRANEIAIQPNGKIVACGFTKSSTVDFALARYNSDGSLDPSFYGDGKVTTGFLDFDSAVSAVAIGGQTHPWQSPRAFLVGYSGNWASNDFAVAVLNPAASSPLIKKRRTTIGPLDDRANAVALGPNGKMVVAGYTHNGTNTDFAMVRYSSDDSLTIDPFFGQSGRVITDFGGNNDEAKAIAIQPDSHIVVVGQTGTGGGAALVVARYDNFGRLDPSFGMGGSVIIPAIQNPRAMLIQPDGKILVGGSTAHMEPPFGDNFALARFLPDGSLDASFSGDGIAATRFDFSSGVNALAFRPQGKIVAAGVTREVSGTWSRFALASYNPDGSPDISFGGEGKVATSFDGPGAATAVGVQRNGKIVAVGSSIEKITGFSDFSIARYNVNGSLDTSFDADGMQTTDFSGNDDAAFAAVIDGIGGIIAAGSAYRDGHTDFAAVRYLPGSNATRGKFDFDGDGRSDVSVFRPSNSQWYLNRSSAGFTAVQFGLPTDKLTPADYDGDGKTDVSVYRDGTWYWLDSSTGAFRAVAFGLADDVPLPADFTGDGRDDLAIFRGGVWWTHDLLTNQSRSIHFGISTDQPVPADYDGDGIADPAVFRGGVWHLLRSMEGYYAVQFGFATDRPVPADYGGDGKADLTVYRDGRWYGNHFYDTYFGLPTDTPAPADYDGDGDADVAVFRDGAWHMLLQHNSSGGGYLGVNFGLPNDKPIPAAFLP